MRSPNDCSNLRPKESRKPSPSAPKRRGGETNSEKRGSARDRLESVQSFSHKNREEIHRFQCELPLTSK